MSHRVPFVYEANLWSIVFPLGMYAVACTELGRRDSLPWLTDVGRVWIWVAVTAWTLTSAMAVRHVVLDVVPPALRNAV